MVLLRLTIISRVGVVVIFIASPSFCVKTHRPVDKDGHLFNLSMLANLLDLTKLNKRNFVERMFVYPKGEDDSNKTKGHD